VVAITNPSTQVAEFEERADQLSLELIDASLADGEVFRPERVNDFAAGGGINLVCWAGWYSGCLSPWVG